MDQMVIKKNGVVMKGFILILLCAITFASCTNSQGTDINDCTRMVTCTLVGCDGENFGRVEVPACEAERFERGCCEPRPNITCNCDI